ncbi:MAG: protein tyrosine phosphatase [Gammaproteobacteria bacterium]|nr:protein tyrosine phosphatase [Gammaproteobacteria bacterium]
MSRTIYVSSLFEMHRWVRAHRPSHLISVIQHELQPSCPEEISPQCHLRLGVDDISEPMPDLVMPGQADVAALIDFLGGWRPADGSLLVHCYAGISRSTACALIAHVMQTKDPERSVAALATASPHARPNRRIIALADSLLGYNGALSAARAAMPEGLPAVEAPLTVFTL